MRRPTRILAWLLLLAPAVAAQDYPPAEPSEIEPLAPRSLLLDGARAGGRLVLVGERGHVLLSDDEGASWRQVVVPARAMLTAVYFVDAELGWAVGHDAVILRTTDGGERWQMVHRAPEEERPLLDVRFEDAAHGLAIGAYGFLLRSDDGGESWTPGSVGDVAPDDPYVVGDDFHLNQISRAADGRLYIAAEAGTIYRSDDAGASWLSLDSPYEGSFFATLPLGGDALLLLGLRGHLFRSDDAGESWQALESHTQAMLTDGLLLPDGTVVLAGLDGVLLISHDGGRHFELHEQPDRQGISALLRTADGGLLLVGEHGATKLSAVPGS